MSIVFRPVLPGDRPALLQLFRTSFGAEPSPDEWVWKYDRNPRRSISVGAFDDERAVGFFGGIGTRYRGADGDLPGTSSVDVMTDPLVRSLGKTSFFKELGETYKRRNAEIGIPFDFGFPHERARKIEERLLGCVTIERAGQLACPVEGLSRGRRRAGRLLRRARVDEPFGAEHRPLVETLHGRAGWRTDRSAEVLNWRFSGRPGVTYRSVQLVGLGGGSLGYAVLRITSDAALLVDLQLGSETSPALGDLLAEVARVAEAVEAARTLRVRLAQGSPLAARLAGEFSFVREESDTVFLVRSLLPEFDLLPAARQFDYRYGDHDVF